MEKVFEIYINDLKNIFKNYAAIITILALCILPSLYAWFNIAASWNPYDKKSTSQIKIGVVNKDYGTELRGENINFGDKVVESLKENDLMGWTFLDEEEADRLLEEGKIYATITISNNFSEDMTSVLTSDIRKPEIIYKVNEKVNAIAPKLTIKGATGIQENINKTLVETVSDILLTETKNIGIKLEDAKPKITSIYNELKEVQSKFIELNQTIDLASDGIIKIKDLSKDINENMPLIKETLYNSKTLTSGVKEFLYTSKNSLNELSPIIKDDIYLASKISSNISEYCDLLIEAINNNEENAGEIIDSIIVKTNNLDKLLQSITKVLESINNFSPKLDSTIERINNIRTNVISLKSTLDSIKQSIDSNTEVDLPVLNNLKTFADNINKISSDLYSKYDTEILEKINIILDNASKTGDNVITILNEAENKLPAVSELLTTAYEGADKGSDILKYAKEKLPIAEETVNTLISKIEKIDNSEEFAELIELLKEDISLRSDFLSAPVNLIQETLFPMENYGTAMTPFYTTLSLWTGLLFLVSLLSIRCKNGECTEIEEYFGKMLLFLSIAIIQAIIVSMGDLYLLKIYCLNPLLFLIVSILTSVLFTAIVYTACSVFGNAGKVICIVLLVFQIGGSGGTFPIELTPHFFQEIHPFLPFTYTISLMRETIGGIVKSIVVKDIAIILTFIIISLILGVFLKKPFNKFIRGFTEKFHESNLGE